MTDQRDLDIYDARLKVEELLKRLHNARESARPSIRRDYEAAIKRLNDLRDGR